MTEQEQKRKHLYDFLLKTMTDQDKAILFVGRKSVADDISSENLSSVNRICYLLLLRLLIKYCQIN